jgi:hypothetical protein
MCVPGTGVAVEVRGPVCTGQDLRLLVSVQAAPDDHGRDDERHADDHHADD